MRADLISPSPSRGLSVPIEETELQPDAVQHLIPTVTGHSTNLFRSLRLMPARIVRCGSLFPTSLVPASLCCLLWLAASSSAFSQTTPNSTEATTDDVKGNVEGKDSGPPPGLIQKREVLPAMEIEKELYTEGDEKEFARKYKTAFENALKSAAPTDDEKKALDAGAKYWVYRFTMKKYRDEEVVKKGDKPGAPRDKSQDRLPDLRKKLLDTIKLAAKPPTQAARDYFLKQVTDRSSELLDNNYVVRENIILLLGSLSSNYPPPGKTTDPTPYDLAYTVLLKVIKDETQHDALKVSAVIGLIRICRLGLPLPDGNNEKKRAEIAMALVPELAKKNTFWWYQARLAECLGAASITYDSAANKTNPIVLQTLAEVVADDKRHLQVRVEAAKAIGRLPLDNSLNMTPVVYHIVNLGYHIIQANNANPKKELWVNYFFIKDPPFLGFGLYYAFKAENGNAKLPGGKRKPGLLDAQVNAKEIKEAYEQILSMTLHFIDNAGKPAAVPAAQIKGIEEWLKTHEPKEPRITNGSPPLGSKKVEPAKGKEKETPPASTPAGGGARE